MSKTILVVEDEESIREIVSTILGRAGFQVFSAADPTEAARIWSDKRSSIDALVTDLALPVCTGAEMAREFLAYKPNLPVIFLTGSDRLIAIESADLVPHKAILQKPFTKDQLLDALLDV